MSVMGWACSRPKSRQHQISAHGGTEPAASCSSSAACRPRADGWVYLPRSSCKMSSCAQRMMDSWGECRTWATSSASRAWKSRSGSALSDHQTEDTSCVSRGRASTCARAASSAAAASPRRFSTQRAWMASPDATPMDVFGLVSPRRCRALALSSMASPAGSSGSVASCAVCTARVAGDDQTARVPCSTDRMAARCASGAPSGPPKGGSAAPTATDASMALRSRRACS
mmetsp:Transcript_20517/g.66509  ORF Transcript_20517/g.66509 Transcript_20517/m.66509 type:complete len:228 (-) Transcript_20517:3190-3873(-)